MHECLMRMEMHSHLLDLKDSHKAFRRVSMNVNITFFVGKKKQPPFNFEWTFYEFKVHFTFILRKQNELLSIYVISFDTRNEKDAGFQVLSMAIGQHFAWWLQC